GGQRLHEQQLPAAQAGVLDRGDRLADDASDLPGDGPGASLLPEIARLPLQFVERLLDHPPEFGLVVRVRVDQQAGGLSVLTASASPQQPLDLLLLGRGCLALLAQQRADGHAGHEGYLPVSVEVGPALVEDLLDLLLQRSNELAEKIQRAVAREVVYPP